MLNFGGGNHALLGTFLFAQIFRGKLWPCDQTPPEIRKKNIDPEAEVVILKIQNGPLWSIFVAAWLLWAIGYKMVINYTPR